MCEGVGGPQCFGKSEHVARKIAQRFLEGVHWQQWRDARGEALCMATMGRVAARRTEKIPGVQRSFLSRSAVIPETEKDFPIFVQFGMGCPQLSPQYTEKR